MLCLGGGGVPLGLIKRLLQKETPMDTDMGCPQGDVSRLLTTP